MKKTTWKRLHDSLDGAADAGAALDAAGAAELGRYRRVLDALARASVPAPDGLSESIMAAVRLERPPRRRALRFLTWTNTMRWGVPLAAAATALLAATVWWGSLARRGTVVTFELHAPAAARVELVGSFNHWQTGQTTLAGPDATGAWRATLRLRPGRYEYMFVVDGRDWVTDPAAVVHRADGFGRRNAIVEIVGG